MIRRCEREEGVKPGLIQSVTYGVAAAHEIELPLTGFERPGEPQDGADASKVDELELLEIDGHVFGFGVKPLFDGSGEVGTIGRVHAAVGSSDQSLSFVL
jgi:hypothetical protein